MEPSSACSTESAKNWDFFLDIPEIDRTRVKP